MRKITLEAKHSARGVSQQKIGKKTITKHKLKPVTYTHREFEMSSFLSISLPSISAKYFFIGNLINKMTNSLIKFGKNDIKVNKKKTKIPPVSYVVIKQLA